MIQSLTNFRKELDENGWWQLSTIDYLIHHMGNQIQILKRNYHGSKIYIPNQMIISNFFKQKEKKIAIKSTYIRKIIKRIHTWSYEKLYG